MSKGLIVKQMLVLIITAFSFSQCKKSVPDSNMKTVKMNESQISFSAKNHVLDNNDNFSSDNRFLCYDTRGTVFNTDIGNSKTIEKIEIASGKETVLYQPESITGEQAAPGIGAVSYHPKEDKVIFIHGPLLSEVEERGYYGIPNRTGVEVSADGKGRTIKVDMHDVATNRETIHGAQRGGTHRHEYSRNGKRIGFTYNDLLCPDYDRTIGYMETTKTAPDGYTHFFAVLLKPARIGESKPGEIEKAYADSWVDSEGRMRAFIGNVRAENGTDYQEDLFVADIPDDVEITTAFSGDATTFPEPPEGVKIRRLTHSGNISGIVRGSNDGKWIACLSKDEKGIDQVTLIHALGSDLSENTGMQPKVVSHFKSNAGAIRWHPSGEWIFSLVEGNIAASCTRPGKDFGKSVMLTNDEQKRMQMVVSGDGNRVAYNIAVPTENEMDNEKLFRQIFVLDLDIDKINAALK
ncbi:DUF3748 domain-containing protein [Prolixibacteraceae bacterium Z1-6]|uniref:DUF3748 domain-containing protein n=1 Tax=Draconibacterium aestuarii TaxID=2998507 RepID=A0A9X3FBB5_9BACT|nr:DUF3748 domain-containing protein [Prolixibacteraceae bacterium Z1-6]